ncbi:MAG: TasA family protein [Candidatus Nanopelagicales bacterium]
MAMTASPRATNLGRAALLLAAGIGGLALIVTTVYATLSAQAYNATPTSTSAGTLSLIQADNGNGFTTPIDKMAPGDTVYRYVKYTNNGNLDAQDLKLSLADSVNSVLTTDATRGLSVTVTQCSVAWTPASGACGGTSTSLGTSTAVALKTTPLSLAVVPTTPAGANILAGQEINLRFAITLPDTNETTVNGVPPANTVQGKTAALTWTLTEAMRNTATTTS